MGRACHTALLVLLVLATASCALTAAETVPPPTAPPPSATAPPTPVPTATETPIPPTATVTPTATTVPQPLLLRRHCGRDYAVRADEPVELLYGGWGVISLDLAEQWESALVVELAVDGESVEGKQQPPATELPYNCDVLAEGAYVLYYRAVIPALSAGTHQVTVTFNALRALPDGFGLTYGPGQVAVQTFRIIAQ